MNKSWRKSLAVATLSGAFAVAGVVGFNLFQNVQFARAEQQVEATRQQLSTVQDLSSVFKEVGTVVEPSVVSIRVTKTVKGEGLPQQFQEPFRRFFRQMPNNPQGENPQGEGEQPELPPNLFGPHQFKEMGMGSGVIMDVSGSTAYILTNNHVAGGASEMVVTLNDGRVIKDAKLVGADPKTDLAVVQINADHLIPAKWGDSHQLQQGDWVMAFGAPFGYVGSMTHGIVSALHRQAGIIDGGEGYESFIQVDAPINPGNSGGPLVNIRGDVVGINTAIASRSGGFQGIGFAIPSDMAKPIYTELKEKGQVVRGWLGLQIENVAQAPEAAKAIGYKGETGVLVHSVLKDTPAAGKLQPGDVITSLNGKSVKDANELRDAVALDAPGKEVKLGVFRDGKQQDVTVKLGEQPESPNMALNGQNPNQPTGKLGLGLSDLTGNLAQRFGVNAKSGAMVVAVKPGSPAAQAGLRPGDVITQVNQQSVNSAHDAAQDLAKADLSKGVRLLVTNREGSELIFMQSSQHG